MKCSRIRIVFVVGALAVLAVGCSSDGGDSSSSALSELDGREFWSTEVLSGGLARALVDDTRITVRFDGDQIGASAGCNSMGGAYGLEGQTLVVPGLFMTEMGCDPARMQQDTFVSELLSSGPILSLDGDRLTITYEGTTIRLLDSSVANPDVDLPGTEWTVTGFIDGDSASAFAVDEAAWVRFASDSTMSGFDGCTTFSAPVEVSDGSTGGPVEGDGEFQFGDLTASAPDCANPQYVAMVRRLFESGAASYTLEGDRLTISDRDGFGVTFAAE